MKQKIVFLMTSLALTAPIAFADHTADHKDHKDMKECSGKDCKHKKGTKCHCKDDKKTPAAADAAKTEKKEDVKPAEEKAH